MPRLSIWLLRISLLELLAGAGLGAWLLAAEPWGSLWVTRLRAAHVFLMLFGWLVPFVLGTAYWMLPKHAAGPIRGPAWAGWTAGALVWGGQLVGTLGALVAVRGLEQVGTLGVIAGAAGFVALLWPRIKVFGEGRNLEVSARRE